MIDSTCFQRGGVKETGLCPGMVNMAEKGSEEERPNPASPSISTRAKRKGTTGWKRVKGPDKRSREGVEKRIKRQAKTDQKTKQESQKLLRRRGSVDCAS